MKITQIVLDLDDTLNSCTMHVLRSLGCEVGQHEYSVFPSQCGYDILAAWSHITGRDKVEPSVFWEWVSRKTWETMPRSGQFWLLDAAAAMVGKENVMIATVPTKSPDCHYAKYKWMEKNLPPWMARQYSVTPRKHWLSHPGVLLIDDCDHNIKQWLNPFPGRKGGDAILVPRPWNPLKDIGVSTGETNSYLAAELAKREATNTV